VDCGFFLLTGRRSILIAEHATVQERTALRDLQPVRYEDGRPMLFAGLRRKHTFASMAEDIPRQWADFLKLGRLPGQIGTTAYGAICGGDPKTQTMEYMCAVEVESFDALPKDLGRMRVPAVRYAVFVHEDNVSTIRDTCRQLFAEWLPSSGLQSAETPDFEVYDERFNGATGEGGVEIWLGVKSADQSLHD
jgi:predicted transcriptional regulator YdeE